MWPLGVDFFKIQRKVQGYAKEIEEIEEKFASLNKFA